jgi:hypothetical protein
MMKEYEKPTKHKRFRIQGTGLSAGSHIDVALTPEGKGACLHVFLKGAKVAGKMTAAVEGKTQFPVDLCGDCKRVASARKN